MIPANLVPRWYNLHRQKYTNHYAIGLSGRKTTLQLLLYVTGLKVAAKLYPQGLITGTIPPSILPSNKGKPLEPPSKDKFDRMDVYALLDQTETSYDTRSTISSELSADIIVLCTLPYRGCACAWSCVLLTVLLGKRGPLLAAEYWVALLHLIIITYM